MQVRDNLKLNRHGASDIQEGKIIEYALPGQDTNTVGMTSTGGN